MAMSKEKGLIYIPAMFILGAIFHETGLIWVQPVADVLSLLLAIGLYLHTSRKTDFGSWDGDPSAARISFYWKEMRVSAKMFNRRVHSFPSEKLF